MQRSSDSTVENGNRTEETQHGPLNIGMGQENGNKLNKQIGLEPRGDEGSIVVFHVH